MPKPTPLLRLTIQVDVEDVFGLGAAGLRDKAYDAVLKLPARIADTEGNPKIVVRDTDAAPYLRKAFASMDLLQQAGHLANDHAITRTMLEMERLWAHNQAHEYTAVNHRHAGPEEAV